MMRRAKSAQCFSASHEPVSMDSMEKICIVLNCNIGDVMAFITDESNGGKDA